MAVMRERERERERADFHLDYLFIYMSTLKRDIILGFSKTPRF